jgi:hypothetical protein
MIGIHLQGEGVRRKLFDELWKIPFPKEEERDFKAF